MKTELDNIRHYEGLLQKARSTRHLIQHLEGTDLEVSRAAFEIEVSDAEKVHIITQEQRLYIMAVFYNEADFNTADAIYKRTNAIDECIQNQLHIREHEMRHNGVDPEKAEQIIRIAIEDLQRKNQESMEATLDHLRLN